MFGKEKTQEENNLNTQNKKKLKIVLIVVISAVLVGVIVGLLLHFTKKIPEIKTDYGTLKSVIIDSENSFTLCMSAPYSSKDIEYTYDNSAKCILTKEQGSEQFETEISKIEYSSQKNDDIQKGTVEITFEVKNGFKFDDKTAYIFEMPDKTVTEKKTGQSVGGEKVQFVTEETIDGKFSAKMDLVTDYEVQKTELNEVKIEKIDNEYFLVFKINEKETVNLNEKGLEDQTTGITYVFKDESIKMATVFEGITSVADKSDGTVTVKCPIKKEDVISGTEYVVYLSKGLLLNGEATKGSGEMTETFTYMG